MSRKRLYIISGCNGAGKTTASRTILTDALKCKYFVNADEIAKQLCPEDVKSVAVKAGKIMLKQIDLLLAHRATFSIETTLASRSYFQLIERAHKLGYKVVLIFFWLNNPYLAINRVKLRVAEGGHHVDEQVILRRYKMGINNLFEIYMKLVDFWVIIDNSQLQRINVAEGRNKGKTVTVHDMNRLKMMRRYGKK